MEKFTQAAASRNRIGMVGPWLRISLGVVIVCLSAALAHGQATANDQPVEDTKPDASRSAAAAALEKLKLPGVKINLEERCVDVAASVCLDAGMLELVACAKDTKEHESIVVIDAKAMHIHTALLLLGAKPGNPAMRKRADSEELRWIHVPPSGGKVDVSLVFKNKAGEIDEHPISDFIVPADPANAGGQKTPGGEGSKFPTDTFLFAGSHLVAGGDGPRTYLSDRDGNVISIATFGDELLCLPDVHSHQNGALLWQVDGTNLPAVGTKVTLRLRPQLAIGRKAHPAPTKATPR